MAYLNHATQAGRSKAVVGVIAIHAAIGYVLVSGMAVDFIETVITPNPVGTFVLPEPPPPEPPKPQPDQKTDYTQPTSPPIYTPPSALDLNRNPIEVDTTNVILPPFDPVIPKPGASVIPKPFPSATTPSFTPVDVKPRGDPGAWVTTNDYRSSWINREMVGTAAFKVQVGANGRAESCLITRSSGHDVLDKATCDLISKRARFEPAKNSKGEKVAGSYSSSVRWQLPD